VPAIDDADRSSAAANSPDDIFASLSSALGRGSGPPLPDELVLGGDCPAAGPEAEEEIAAQAAGRVPLKVGLTLTNLWRRNPGEEFECLLQVTEVRRDSIDATLDCNLPNERPAIRRRLCRADLGDARMLMTETGMMTVIDASGEDVPETMVGATWFSLSQREFAELKRTGSVKHRYVQPHASGNRLDVEATAVLRNEGAETSRIAINDSVVQVPVIRASGEFSGWYHNRSESGRLTALILDDERFPLLVDYVHMTGPDPRMAFRLNYAKISYPDREKGDRDGQMNIGTGNMERRLAEERSVDVYGIYFDFNSDRIREESEPILEEIADVLGRNAAWTLSINGHTDNVGGAAYNRDLSRRRSAAVRDALVERYGIAATRLTFAGHGDVAPKDTNDTPEGRARNRRVELIRR
jgi:outer membrane protein OmpA-like peptidoglycan-associated protein